MHETIGGGPGILGRPLEGATRLVTKPIYGGIRAVTDVVGASVDGALAQLGPLLGESAPGPERELVLAVLNGVLGDYLSTTDNPLAVEMRLRSGGRALTIRADALRAAFPESAERLLVLVHGSCMSDRQWARKGHDHGASLARALGCSPLYLNYNSGLHISTNGRSFATLLEELLEAWPVPVVELDIVGHSMGGLLARSACHTGEVAGHRWRDKLRRLVCLGSPHHGAPLERGGNWVDALLGLSRYSAPLARLGKIRSAGVTDMRYGTVLENDWRDWDRFERGPDSRTPLPLPRDVASFAIAGTTARAPAPKLPSDGLVPVDSALGRCDRPELALAFPEAHRWIAFGARHLDLLDRQDVFERMVSWLS